MKALALALSVLLAACLTEKNPNFCASDADCAGTPRPFCDVNGEFTPSNGTSNVCTETPSDCPIERCGCTPGESLACDADQLTVCAADGISTSTATCALGCSTEDRCLTFEPSNGLGPALEMAAAEPDVVFPSGTQIDTDLGTVRDQAGALIAVRSIVVPQADAPSIQVFLAHTFDVDATQVQGARPVAFVAAGTTTIRGLLRARATGRQNGPGAQDFPAPCVGSSARLEGQQFSKGAGGGGNAVPGGGGGNIFTPGPAGGANIVAFSPLVGGCRGGDLFDVAGIGVVSRGGAGGGAVQIVSGEEIRLTGFGFVDIGAGGGEPSGGGGSGGIAVLEAPIVRLDGSTTGITANGGAGGGRATIGADATASGIVAQGADAAGSGGTGSAAPSAGFVCTGTCVSNQHNAGGGGSVGRLKVSTKASAIVTSGAPVLSVAVTSATLVAE